MPVTAIPMASPAQVRQFVSSDLSWLTQLPSFYSAPGIAGLVAEAKAGDSSTGRGSSALDLQSSTRCLFEGDFSCPRLPFVVAQCYSALERNASDEEARRVLFLLRPVVDLGRLRTASNSDRWTAHVLTSRLAALWFFEPATDGPYRAIGVLNVLTINYLGYLIERDVYPSASQVAIGCRVVRLFRRYFPEIYKDVCSAEQHLSEGVRGVMATNVTATRFSRAVRERLSRQATAIRVGVIGAIVFAIVFAVVLWRLLR